MAVWALQSPLFGFPSPMRAFSITSAQSSDSTSSSAPQVCAQPTPSAPFCAALLCETRSLIRWLRSPLSLMGCIILRPSPCRAMHEQARHSSRPSSASGRPTCYGASGSRRSCPSRQRPRPRKIPPPAASASAPQRNGVRARARAPAARLLPPPTPTRGARARGAQARGSQPFRAGL